MTETAPTPQPPSQDTPTLNRPRPQGMSNQTKIAVLTILGVVAVALGGFWAFYELTTVRKPDLQTASAEQVVEFLGDPRGFARLPLNERQTFLSRMFKRYNDYENRLALNENLATMSSTQSQVLLDAIYEVAHNLVMTAAEEFNNLPPSERGKHLDNTIRRFLVLRGEMSGGGDTRQNIGEPFRKYMPTGSDELGKLIVSRTTPEEREKAQPFIDALAQRYKEKFKLLRTRTN